MTDALYMDSSEEEEETESSEAFVSHDIDDARDAEVSTNLLCVKTRCDTVRTRWVNVVQETMAPGITAVNQKGTKWYFVRQWNEGNDLQ